MNTNKNILTQRRKAAKISEFLFSRLSFAPLRLSVKAFSAICILQSAICNSPAAPAPVFDIKVNPQGDIISSTLPANHIVNFPSGTILQVNGVTITGSGLPTQAGHTGEYLTTNGTAASWVSLSLQGDDTAYDATSWNGNTGVATKNVVRDKFETLRIGTDIQAYDSGLGLVKPAVALVAVSNLTLSGEQTIDGITTVNSLVLCTAQTTAANNGPWISASGAWTRPTWYATGSTSQAPQFLTTFVRLGTTYSGSTWRMTTAAVTIGTTAQTWVQTPVSLASGNVTGTLSGSNVSGGTFGAVNGSALTALNASNLGSGTVPTARLGSGTANSTTVLYGDQTYKTIDLSTYAPLASPTFTGTVTAPLLTLSGASAASVPAELLSGAWFTGGTGTTNFPHFLLQATGTTASTTWSTAGTGIGVNAVTGFTGNLMDLMLAGVSKAKITSAGALTLANNVTCNDLTLGTGRFLNLRSGVNLYSSAANEFAAQASIFVLSAGTTTSNSDPGIGRDAVNGFTLKSGAGTTTWNDASTANSGTVANRYLFGIAAPTLTATGTSVTNTVASTVYIGGPPTDSTNTTSTTKWALNVAAGNSFFGGNVTNNGGLTVAASVKTTTYTVTASDYYIVGNHATVAFTITMIAASSNTGKVFKFKNKGAASVTIDATGLGQIFGVSAANTRVLATGDAITLTSDGATWVLD